MNRGLAFGPSELPDWLLRRPKPPIQAIYDLFGAPLRMALLPDAASERVHLTSLRGERFAAVLPELRGRVLDIGAGDNALVRTYRRLAPAFRVDPADAAASVGADVLDWGGGCTIVESPARLPFPDGSFDTVAFIACINHVTGREAALQEARRVLRPHGRVVLTMIGRWIGSFGHAIWWYSEDKHRHVDEEELMGMDKQEVVALLRGAGFASIASRAFAYGLNRIYVAET